VSKKAIAAGAAAVIAAAAAIVKPWEGLEPQVYADIVGVPTVCYGHTGRDVLLGQPRRTVAECNRLLDGDLSAAYATVKRCIPEPLPAPTEAALVSFVFNVGPSGVCGSTLQKHMRAGDIARGCGQLMRWVYAGGRRVQGLVNRRQAEYRVCMEGV
jgi:lysozyme